MSEYLQRWEGFVEERTPDSFIARLVDLHDDKAPEEEAEILLSAVAADDLSLVVPGAVFSWNIGRAKETGECVSSIRFRRFPVLTKSDVERAREEAQVIGARLGWSHA